MRLIALCMALASAYTANARTYALVAGVSRDVSPAVGGC